MHSVGKNLGVCLFDQSKLRNEKKGLETLSEKEIFNSLIINL